VLAFAAPLPWTPLGAIFGLVPLPAVAYAALAAMTLAYLVVLEAAKRRFWRSQEPLPTAHRRALRAPSAR
jgi:P-type Mg2+ transporter